MVTTLDPLDLRSAGAREFIMLTNNQFVDWMQALVCETNAPIKPGSLMNYWFILSNLALYGDSQFRMSKKDAFLIVPNLKPEAVRKHVAALGSLGFVETVRLKKEVYLRLTPEGQRAVARTTGRWIREFHRINEKHFRDANGNDADTRDEIATAQTDAAKDCAKT